MVKPSRRREMARAAVAGGRTNIRHACQTFEVSETCYRYQAKAREDTARIADWLVRLTTAHRDCGFGLSFLYLRNVKSFGWNHKRVYRIYRELELNLRIKPKKRVVRERPEPLAVAVAINEVWSMDFMHDSLSDGRSVRLFSVLEDFNREGLAIEVDLSLPSARVIRSLQQTIEWCGKPNLDQIINFQTRRRAMVWQQLDVSTRPVLLPAAGAAAQPLRRGYEYRGVVVRKPRTAKAIAIYLEILRRV